MRSIELIIHLFQRFCWLDEGLQARVHERGWPDISRPQSMVMINIVSGVTRPSDIARRLGVSRQAIHTTIAQMIDKGVVTLEDDPDDARHKRLALTAFGERMRNDAQAAMTELTGVLAARIGQERFDQLLETLAADWGKPV
ncbi:MULTISPECIES: MarR family winged helix-turn-helix transcriptional regulator [unclassified Sphingomonas]|uniref:MarR family winged helix-turn-helix transcriptional regulator n=1 Tax=unclassified Sphingomonas TaxID=196159 RepID=UPI0009281FBF|nr:MULTISPECIES: MarR family winged helix-turn-helix transcriptional regulator [unclassified Sphingomonas]OJU22174.1 MAG: MarR family transcriptional regulator [Sphingomonas sp. 66-10]